MEPHDLRIPNAVQDSTHRCNLVYALGGYPSRISSRWVRSRLVEVEVEVENTSIASIRCKYWLYNLVVDEIPMPRLVGIRIDLSA
jgi:hypothetical protein